MFSHVCTSVNGRAPSHAACCLLRHAPHEHHVSQTKKGTKKKRCSRLLGHVASASCAVPPYGRYAWMDPPGQMHSRPARPNTLATRQAKYTRGPPGQTRSRPARPYALGTRQAVQTRPLPVPCARDPRGAHAVGDPAFFVFFCLCLHVPRTTDPAMAPAMSSVHPCRSPCKKGVEKR